MRYYHHLSKMARLSPAHACLIEISTHPAVAQNVVDQWSNVQVPPPPEFKKVTIEPKSTALLI
jgi:hypothetical protein